MIFTVFFGVFGFSLFRLSDAPRPSKQFQKLLQDGLRGPQEIPKTAQQGLKTAQVPPKKTQEREDEPKNQALRPKRAQKAPIGFRRAPTRPP